MHEHRKKIAVFLVALMFITILTTQYSKTKVSAAVETVVSQFAVDAVAKLLVAVSGAYLIEKINEEYDMNLDSNDVVQTVDAVKTLYHIFLTTDGFKLEDKTTGEQISIKTDTTSVASHLITQTTPSDSHNREFYNWYMSNVSKKLGQYHIRVREWSDTYSRYIDRYYASDNPVELHKYVPKQYQNDYMQLFADMQNMVKDGFLTNGIEKGFLTSGSSFEPLPAQIESQIISDKADGFDKYIFIKSEILRLSDNRFIESFYLFTGSSLEMYEDGGKHYIASFDSLYRVYKYKYISESYDYDLERSYEFVGYGTYRPIFDFSNEISPNVYSSTDSSYENVYQVLNANTAVTDGTTTVGLQGTKENSPVTIPLFPPVIDDSGSLVLDNGAVEDVPIEEDQDGVPFVPPTWWDDFFRRYFGDLVPSDGTYDGTLTDMTDTQLLQEIASNTKGKLPWSFTDGTAILDLLKDKFGLFYQLYDFFKGILQADYSPQKPEFNVTFNGQLGIHGTYNILNLDWYDNNRNYIMLFITSTTWFFTGLKLFRRLPKVIET